ncbi:MAG: hypothetical protein IJ203_13345 [Atopobiaceae bacterium]|jgi:hypothetical protein|nr:hypothetical protein [Atopobiaceae bacterium]
MAVDGTYRVTVEAMGTTGEGTLELKTQGSKLAGTVRAMGMDVALQDGVVKGQTFSGKIEGPTPMGTMAFKVTGEVSGDRISGKLRAGLIGATFSGTRA